MIVMDVSCWEIASRDRAGRSCLEIGAKVAREERFSVRRSTMIGVGVRG